MRKFRRRLFVWIGLVAGNAEAGQGMSLLVFAHLAVARYRRSVGGALGHHEVMDRSHVERWVDGYERAWRTAGTDALADLFSPDASYLPSPWAAPVRGMAAIARLWDDEREGPDEPFTMAREILAVDGTTAVVRVSVDYGGEGAAATQRWRDLWVIRFDDDGRCAAFEEWPFAPGQRDGHERPN